jgi:catechol 2,3-dioxygenase-like lactoylglutathione lyase family enzyme
MKLTSLLFLVLICLQTEGQTTTHVDAIGITVSDLDHAIDFYTRVLLFKKISETEVYGEKYEQLKGLFGIRYRKARLRLGDEEIELTDYLTTGGRSIPEDSRSNDLWFQHIAIVVSNMDSAYARLKRNQVAHVSTAPQTLPKSIPAAEGVKAFYFRDPDGHNLELIYYPKGKGNAKWHADANRSTVFLGIDHTAIGISQTEQSRKFYGDLLGVNYQGESLNFGTEQEHLNNVFGSRVHITGNKAAGGPGVEFLEYITPKDGRPYPQDVRADDLIHWETILLTSDIEILYQKLKREPITFISTSIVSLSSYTYKKGFYIRDPDGHVIGIFQL